MQLHYQTLGKGQPLILVHGLFGSADNWGKVAKYFSATHQVITVDLRNHGRSPHHDSNTYQDMAHDFVELLDYLGLETVHLLAHSLGGKAAMQFAQDFPERLKKLIIVDMAMRAYTDEHTHLIDAMQALDLSQIYSRLEADKALTASIPNSMVRQFLLMNLDKTDAGWAWRINLTAIKANYHSLLQAISPMQYDKPSLFIRGERSQYVNDNDVAQIRSQFTQAQFISLPTDHWVHAEAPEQFITTLAQFLTD